MPHNKVFARLPAFSKKINFWDQPRKGANFFHNNPEEGLFAAAHDFGFQFIRLAFEGWPAAKRHFLLGNADHYQELIKEDQNFSNGISREVYFDATFYSAKDGSIRKFLNKTSRLLLPL